MCPPSAALHGAVRVRLRADRQDGLLSRLLSQPRAGGPTALGDSLADAGVHGDADRRVAVRLRDLVHPARAGAPGDTLGHAGACREPAGCCGCAVDRRGRLLDQQVQSIRLFRQRRFWSERYHTEDTVVSVIAVTFKDIAPKMNSRAPAAAARRSARQSRSRSPTRPRASPLPEHPVPRRRPTPRRRA